MKTYTQQEYNAMPVIEKHKLCPTGDYTAIKLFEPYSVFADGCIFGPDSMFGDYNTPNDTYPLFEYDCIFGEYCKFGSGCMFAEGCKFGRGCRFADNCKFAPDCDFAIHCILGAECVIGSNAVVAPCCVFNTGCSGSPAGLWFHSTLRPAEPPQPVQASRIDRMSGTYTCPELYAPPSRPGAMDAYRLPSRGACDGGRP